MQISPSVSVRGRRWQLVDVRPYDDCQVITLNRVDATGRTIVRRFLSPADEIRPLTERSSPQRVGHRRWRHACRALLARHTPPGGLSCARKAHIDLLPHQLAPALAVVQGLGTRVLLADGVGLGKTVQAGLIVAELLARRFVDRVLVLTPSGLREQWARELRTRFALDALIADARSLRRRAVDLPAGFNPWDALPFVIASSDYVKRAEVRPAVEACHWDVLIVDEAHHAVGASDRHAAVRALAARAAYVVLLTATPHSGDERAFASLCGLGHTGGIGAATPDALLVFRRPRHLVWPGAARRARTLRVRPSAAEAAMHEALARYAGAVRSEHGDRCLALGVLFKRACSSPWALAESVRRRQATLASVITDSTQSDVQLSLPIGDADEECDDIPPEWPRDISLADAGYERRLLATLLDRACTADSHDSKLRALHRLLRRVNESIIVFTEYRDTLRRLRDGIRGRAVLVLHGGLTRDERGAVLDEFSRAPATVLLATDAAGEGLNLHHHCRLVVSLELPWNPIRLEQRIGRVDRIGQRRRVHAVHLAGRTVSEDRLLARLHARIARANDAIETPDPINVCIDAHDDQRVARAVVFGETEGETPRVEQPFAPFVAPVLAAEAAAEAARLAEARRLLGAVGEKDASEVSAPCVSGWALVLRTRRSRLRDALRGRALLVWGAACHDACGNIVESCLIPAVTRPALVTGLLGRSAPVDALLAERVRTWHREAMRMTTAFRTTRLERERLIVPAADDDGLFQGGLFDRRAERAREDDAAAAGDRERAARARLASFERLATLGEPRLQLLLVVIP
jgi:superfamily II DNA or RNA helicase